MSFFSGLGTLVGVVSGTSGFISNQFSRDPEQRWSMHEDGSPNDPCESLCFTGIVGTASGCAGFVIGGSFDALSCVVSELFNYKGELSDDFSMNAFLMIPAVGTTAYCINKIYHNVTS